MLLEDIKFNKTTYKELENKGYMEHKQVGNFILYYPNKNKDPNPPTEIKFHIARTPWALRQLVNKAPAYPIKSKVWNKKGKTFRPNDKPSEITYYKNGSIAEMKWSNEKGLYHRANGKPAIVRFAEDGLVDKCFWLAEGHDFSDKILFFCNEKKWDHLRLKQEQIEAIKEHFFTTSNYF